MFRLGSHATKTSIALLSILACSATSCTRVKTARAPDGAYSLTCERGMSACVDQAAKLCGDAGYTILDGVSSTHLLGGSSSSYRAAAESASLSVRCGLDKPEKNREGIYRLPEREDEAEPAPVLTPNRSCTPGTTQKCVGPGACEGGQVCAADASGFGVCDCGDRSSDTSPAEASSTAPPRLGADGSGAQPGVEGSPTPGSTPAPVPLK